MARPSKTLHSAIRSLHVRSARGSNVRRSKLVLFGSALILLSIFLLSLSPRHAPSAHSGGFGWRLLHPTAGDGYGNAFGQLQHSFVFVFSTGRSGTQHLSRLLESDDVTRTYITHEEEHMTVRTRTIVDQVYRKLGAGTEVSFNRSARDYVQRTKLPFYSALAAAHNATRLVYTGHVPLAYGLGPALLEAAPEGAVRVLRLRRARVATALSLMALGPEDEDPWGSAPTFNRRWFPTPRDSFTRLEVPQSAWAQLNRFQRWLWYIDDVECRWQALKSEFAGQFEWMEASLEALSVMDGGRGWQAVADFMGVRVNGAEAAARHNSIQYKRREKEAFPEAKLRDWDMQYRQLVGHCRLGGNSKYHW